MAVIRGTQGDDRRDNNPLIGEDEDDRIFGLAGDDFIAGRGGNDWLAGGPGADQIFGNAGNDQLVGLGNDDDLRGGVGNDTIIGHAGNDLIAGGPGNDRGFGFPGDDRIFGHGGDDWLAGGPGDDIMAGGPGDDQLFGLTGADRMLGHDGADRIAGLAGADVLTGGPGADKFVFGNLTHAGDRITDFNPGEGDELVLGGAVGEDVRVVDGDDTIVTVQNDAGSFTELVRLENFAEPGADGRIDVWHGEVQSFGDPGVPQQWVNILGNVETAGLNSLTYSLNGEQEQNLAFQDESNILNRRLFNEGDFNVELDFAELDPSPAHDLVTIRAAFDNGDVSTRDVLIDFEGGSVWPTDFEIDWSEVDDPQEVVQVVDGLWSFDENGARPEEIGFDRILALGDQTWDGSYEVRVSVTMNDITSSEVAGKGVLFGMQWGGHTDPEINGLHTDFVPLATFRAAGDDDDIIQLRPSEFFPDANPDNPSPVGRGFQFDEGVTYDFLIQNERIAGTDDRVYGIKAWRNNDPMGEPDDFVIRQTMTDQEPDGSFLLIAHFVDVTFGDVTVREIDDLQQLQVADVVDDGNSLEPLLAANAEASDSTGSQGSGGGTGEASAPGMTTSDLLTSGDETALAA